MEIINPTPHPEPETSKNQPLWLVFCGFLMGSADVVPGVSGGTMAFLLGIYEELLESVHACGVAGLRLARTWFREGHMLVPWRFLVPLAVGLFLAIFSLARGVSWLLENQPVLVWSFFFGLVLASVFTVVRRIRTWKIQHVLLGAAFALGIYWLIGRVPLETPHTPLFFFLSGALAISAMILPGISGAFILVLLGKYAAVLQAVVDLDLGVLVLVASGAAVGLLSVARLLRWLLKNYHEFTVAALVGLMVGSLRKLWPWKESDHFTLDGHELAGEINVLPPELNLEVLLAVGLAALGFGLVTAIEIISTRRYAKQS